MSVSDTMISGEDFLKKLEECGSTRCNNLWVSGRMPPGTTSGLAPDETNSLDGKSYHDHYSAENSICKALAEALPNSPELRSAFQSASGYSAQSAPGMNKLFDPMSDT